MKRLARPLGLCLILFLVLAAPAPAVAQETAPADDKKEAKAKAKEERVQEYLRKKEERRLRREAEELRKQEEDQARRTANAIAAAEQAQANSSRQAAAARDEGAAAISEAPSKSKRGNTKKERRKQRSTELPRRLAKTHAELVESEFGQDATVASYLDLIGAGQATAQQIAAFGNFLGQSGRLDSALAYYDHALNLDGEDTTIWLNAGTLQRQKGNFNAAAGAYAEALSLDPSHAYAHYNLGAVLDEMGEYDSAIEEYKLALTLDPSLGDPALNPQAANNEKLMAVRLMLYKERTGTLGLPLVTVPDGEVDGGN